MIAEGRVVNREVHGASAEDVRVQLTQAGHVVIGIRQQKKRLLQAARSKFSLALFLQELSTLLEAGLVLTEALEALRDKSDANPSARHIIDSVVAVMYEGRSFSQALAGHPDVFPALLVATVASSEGSGQLHVVLRRYQEYEGKIEVLRKRVTGALIYPAVVIGVGCAVLLFMAFFIVPRFAVVFESVSQRSGSVQAMLWWSQLLEDGSAMVVAGMVAAVVGSVLCVRTARFKRTFRTLLFAIPQVRNLCTLFALTRFYRTVGLLIAGGTPAIVALGLAREVLPAFMHERLLAALAELASGVAVATALSAHRLTTPVAYRLMRVGEQSGDLGAMFAYAAQFHDGTLDRAVDWISKVCEPVLMIAVGATVGAALIMLYMPIFGLADSIG